eukprot:scaffold286540_cov36-Tisochrysis_lutea.AAC.3
MGEKHAPSAHLFAHSQGFAHSRMATCDSLISHVFCVVECRLVHEQAAGSVKLLAELDYGLAWPSVTRVDEPPSLIVLQCYAPRVRTVLDRCGGHPPAAETTEGNANRCVGAHAHAVYEAKLDSCMQSTRSFTKPCAKSSWADNDKG